jgi:prophage regulatory protein
VNILRRPEVSARTGLSSPTIWRLERAGKFPARVQLSANSVGWHESEVEAWIESRDRVNAEKVADEMRRSYEPRGTIIDAG